MKSLKERVDKGKVKVEFTSVLTAKIRFILLCFIIVNIILVEFHSQIKLRYMEAQNGPQD